LKKLTLKHAQKIAHERGGKCLSKEYKNKKLKLEWQCNKGHIWMASLDSVKNIKSWCPECAGHKRLTIKDMRDLAKSRGGECLSTIFLTNKDKLKWKCEKGHTWWAKPNSVKSSNQWCPECGGSKKLTIKQMYKLAESRGGKCLSQKYKGNKNKLEWQCSKNHIWWAKPNAIATGTWCPECSKGTGEKICREFFEQLLKKKFPSTRPSWLRNNRGNKMELDGYCRELKLAFEHQGKQHYSYRKWFMSKEEFLQRLEDDKEKLLLCKRKGINLIIVPEIPSYLAIKKIKKFLKKEFQKIGLSIPEDYDKIQVNLINVYS